MRIEQIPINGLSILKETFIYNVHQQFLVINLEMLLFVFYKYSYSLKSFICLDSYIFRVLINLNLLDRILWLMVLFKIIGQVIQSKPFEPLKNQNQIWVKCCRKEGHIQINLQYQMGCHMSSKKNGKKPQKENQQQQQSSAKEANHSQNSDQGQNKSKNGKNVKGRVGQNKILQEVKVFDNFKAKGGNIFKTYTLVNQEVLGRGKNMQIRKVQHNITGQFRALKVIKKSPNNPEIEEQYQQEVELLKSLNHPNIIKIYETYEDNKNFFVVMELCDGGNVLDLIVYKKQLSEELISQIMKQILLAVSYMHSQGIIHQNIYPDKLLLQKSSKEEVIKLVGFKDAKKAKVSNGFISEQNYKYCSPEQIKEYKTTQKTDIWSCGVILYLFLSGSFPFSGKNMKQTLVQICKGSVSFESNQWLSISKSARKLVQNMLAYNPDERYPAMKLLQDGWFRSSKHKKSKVLYEDVLLSMRQFHVKDKLYKKTLMFIITAVATEEEKSSLMKTFRELDTNNDGLISKEELLVGYKKVYGEENAQVEVDKVFSFVDDDKNGGIDYQEYVLATIDKRHILSTENLRIVFNLLDRDKSGQIDRKEVSQLFINSKIPSHTLAKFLKQMDSNGDGKISFKEFESTMLNIFTI